MVEVGGFHYDSYRLITYNDTHNILPSSLNGLEGDLFHPQRTLF